MSSTFFIINICMINSPFYNAILAKSNILFGTLFNEIVIERTEHNGHVQQIKVPLSYGPREKFLARIEGDPNLDQSVAITLPRISFEIMSIEYDAQRQLNPKSRVTHQTGPKEKLSIYRPVPYNIQYQLNIMVKSDEDGAKILEQILPFFTPTWVISAKLIDDMPEKVIDVPVTLTGVSREDAYEGDFTTRRVLLYTLTFNMKTVFFGKPAPKKIIKIVKADIHSGNDTERVTVMPGLTPNGLPTSYTNKTVVQATASSTISNGSVTKIDVSYNVGYSNAKITIDPPGSGRTAKAKAVIQDDKIVAIEIIDGGSGYTIPPIVTISPPDMASISYLDINPDDNYGYIVEIEDV